MCVLAMAKCSPENQHLLHDGESETSFSSPEKSHNKTDRTLLDLSLSLNVDNGKSDISTHKDDRGINFLICLNVKASKLKVKIEFT